MKIFVFIVLAIFSMSAFSVTSTKYHKISIIQVNGYDKYYYFKTENTQWEAPDCPDAVWAYVRTQDVSVADQILSVALAAKMSGKKVQFTGTCDNANYLRADRITME